MHRAARIAIRGTVVALSLALLLAALLAGVIYVAANTESGRHLIERTIPRLTAGRVRIAGLGGSFPTAIDLRQLELSDERGRWMTAQGVALRWSPLTLLERRVQIDTLEVVRIDVAREPVSSRPPSARKPRIPRIDIAHLSIDTLTLEPAVSGSTVSLSVQGEARLESVEDASARLFIRRIDGDGEYRLQVHADRAGLEADFALEEAAGGLVAQLTGWTGLGALSVSGSVQGPRQAEAIELNARAGPLQAHLTGSVDLDGRSADLVYQLEAPAMAPRPGLAWQRLAAQGHLRGTAATLQADASLRVDALRLGEGLRVDSLGANLTSAHGVMTAHAAATGVTIPGPDPRLLQDGPLRIDATLYLNEPARPLQLAVDQRLFSLHAHAVTAGEQSATFELRLPDLAPFAALEGQQVQGHAVLQGQIAQMQASPHVELQASAELSGTPAWVALVGPAARLQLAATSAGREIRIERLLLNGGAMSLGASGSVQRAAPGAPQPVRAVGVRWNLDLPNLAALAADLAGAMQLNGNVEGPIDALAADFDATSDLSFRGSPRETIQAHVRARGLPSTIDAAVQAQGSFDGAPLQLDASLTREPDRRFRVVVHHTRWKSVQAEADLKAGADLAQGQGNLSLHVERLADLEKLVGTPLQGRLDAELAMTVEAGRPAVQLHIDARDVMAAERPVRAQLTGAGPLEALQLTLEAQTTDDTGAAADLHAAGLLNLAARDLKLERANGTYRGQFVRLPAPVHLRFTDGLQLAAVKLDIAQAVVELDGRLSPQLDVRLSAQHIDAAQIAPWIPDLIAQGTLDADARLTGTWTAPDGHINLKISGLRFADDTARHLPALDLHAMADMSGGAAKIRAQLDAGQASHLQVSGEARIGDDYALNLKISGNLDVALANVLLEAQGQRASGTLAVDAAITGPAAQPDLAGTAELTRGDFRDYALGLRLTDIHARLVGNQRSVEISELDARAGKGSLALTGSFGLSRPYEVDLRLTGRNAEPIISEILTATLNADVHVKGTLHERLDVAGIIDVQRADIGIPKRLPSNVAVLDVRIPGQATPQSPTRRLAIGLDLELRAPRGVYVQGRGLDAELGGRVKIGGTFDAPQVSEGFELIRGSFLLSSSTLTFKQGLVTFNGTGPRSQMYPTLDFTAQTSTSDATVTLHVTGPANAPKFELSSTPPLPQDEILARLLFGESSAQLGALQLAQTGAALASLGGDSGLNPLSKAQKALGLSRLTVGGSVGGVGGVGAASGTASPGSPGNQNTGASISAGRYVSNRVYIGATQSTTGTNQVQVDVELTKNLKLQSRLGNRTATSQGTTPDNDPGSSIGISYHFDY